MSTSCRRRRRARPWTARTSWSRLWRARCSPRPCARRLWRSPRPSRTSASAPRARSAEGEVDERDVERGRSSSATRLAVAASSRGAKPSWRLSDGRLAIASARRATEWEETVEDVADEDDELEYAKEASHLHHSVGGGDDDGACVKLEAVVVSPAGGTFSVLEREDDVPRRVAWLDAETALVAADRPSDGSASLLTVRLSFAYPRDSRVARGSREPRWSFEIVSAVDLPAPANAVARAEGESPPGRSCRCRNTAI